MIPSYPAAFGGPRRAILISHSLIGARRGSQVAGAVFLAFHAYSEWNQSGGVFGGLVGACRSVLAWSMRVEWSVVGSVILDSVVGSHSWEISGEFVGLLYR